MRKITNPARLVLFIITIVFAGALGLSCSAKKSAPDPAQVAAVSAGVLGGKEPVKVQFTRSQDTSKPLAAGVFTLRPAVKGALSWQDEVTLVFTPSEPYKGGQLYQARVKLPGISPFDFDFMAAAPSFSVNLEPVQVSSGDDVLVSGTVSADNYADKSLIEQTVSSKDLGKPSWTHDDGAHRFSFAPVKRGADSRSVEVTWDGRALGAAGKGSSKVTIPGTNSFQMVNIRLNDGVIEVSFSSRLKPYQDLRGFITLAGKTDVRYSLDGNVVKIYGDSSGGLPNGTELTIQDLEDVNGNRLASPIRYTVPDRWELPEVRFTGTGVILPSSQGTRMVVETRNVSGLLVEAFQIYGDNMIQFLQVNNLGGERELDRVGEPVWTKAFNFPWADQDQNRWVRRGLDLSELSRKYPTGMFHIRISFRNRQIHYVCSLGHGDYSHLAFPDDSFPSFRSRGGTSSYWDNYQNSQNYSWREWYDNRMDPCHPAYYIPYSGHNITKGRNVLVSDLGLLAKRNLNGSWLLASTNLVSARASPDTAYKVYNYQGRVLYQGRTGSDGTAVIPAPAPEMAPGSRLVVYAENSLGKAYLKINDSLALAVSQFDVAGGTPSTGIRGLIYGERGVWRPGDDIYLTFLLSDPLGTLPANHPVSFELEDPKGSLVLTRTYTASVDGFYPIAVSTAPDAPTGDWTARARVGGSTFSKSIKIESVMPNRLKMDLAFSGGNDAIKSGPHQVSLGAEWLYGAQAPGLKADVSVTFVDKETAFTGYGDFTFRDPSRTVSSERQKIWEGTLDGKGSANFEMNLNPGTAVPGKVTARFLTRVFEPSGVFSSEQISGEYSPYKRYTGLKLPRGDEARNMLLTDTDHQAEIVVLDEDGKPVQGNVAIGCAIYKLSWRWWWEKGTDEAAEFASILSRNPLSSGTVTAVNGKAAWTFRIKYPDWGRYLVLVKDSQGGHAAAQVVYIDWPGWAGRAQDGGQGSQTMLALTAGKPSYNAGEKVQVSFPSNKDAAALVVVEKGGQIIKSEWIRCEDATTRYEFTAEPSMVPNVYVHVTFLQPHLQTQNDLPLRLYGIIPVTIDDPKIVLHPKISAPPNWEAESKVSFTVSEADGRPMTCTVAVVDEGLLGLTRYTLPNPRSTFYAREASFLKSWDLFQDIIGAYSGKLETLLAIGGGDDGMLDTNKKTQRFKPVVRFFGPYEIRANEQKTETFDLPPYVGALRIMALAASSTKEAQTNRSQRAYGTAETSVKVTSDLMVFASLPRTLSPGDEVEVPVYVNSYKDGTRSVKASISAAGAEVQGPSSQDVVFDKSGEKLIRFKVKAPANPGSLQFIVRSESAGLKSAEQVTDMEVRSTAIPVTKSAYRLISPGDTWKGDLAFPGREGTNTLTAGFSRLPPLNLEARLDFLVRYPHGCVEQTTSGVFPQLYLDKVLTLDDKRRAAIRTNVNAGIERLLGMQIVSGAFAYWPGESTANDWSTSYVGHFLLEARRAGYTVRDSAMKNWLHYQKNTAMLWQAGSGKYVEQAYRLYTIALAGEADLGSMNRLRSQRDLPLQASWRLAAAYWYAGQRDTARNMIRSLSLPTGNYRELSGTFGSALRDKAMILETLVLLNSGQGASQDDLGKTRALFEEISKALSEDTWLSTQETAYALIAMAPYMQNNAGSGDLKADYTAAGTSGSITFNSPSAEQSLGNVAGTGTPFTVTNRSASPLYVKFTARGLPVEGSEPALSEGLALSVEYRNADGKAMNPADLKISEDMDVVVKVRNSYSQAVEEIALVVPISASWEIVNTRLAGENQPPPSFRYQDIRDDRVMTYFNLGRGEEKTITFRVNKAYEGSFFRPAIHAYAMYDESIRALIPGVGK